MRARPYPCGIVPHVASPDNHTRPKINEFEFDQINPRKRDRTRQKISGGNPFAKELA